MTVMQKNWVIWLRLLVLAVMEKVPLLMPLGLFRIVYLVMLKQLVMQKIEVDLINL